MVSLTARVALPVTIILGLLPGCARQGEVAEEQRPAPQTPTAVTADEIRDRPGQPLELILAGRFPGVELRRAPGGGLEIRIRGTTSLVGSNEPLYVLDGMPLEPQPGGSLIGINPYDIASIEVLRDPASTAIYGVRGANGVIIIKTKQP